MKIDDLIQKVFPDCKYEISPLHKGYTNRNYKLNIQDKIYIVRIPWENSEHIVDHASEAKVINAIQDLNLDVPTVYFDPTRGIKITEYIDHLEEFSGCHEPDVIERTARLMKRLHQANRSIHVEFDPIGRYHAYRKHVKAPLYDVSSYEYVLKLVNDLSGNHILCHNDWVSGNILFGKERDYLIDYEYGADNDPLFDVMSFLTENNITDTAKRECFYKTYFDEMNEDIAYRLQLWEKFHNLLWCMWAMMMWEQRADAIYAAIAKEKYDALQKCCLS